MSTKPLKQVILAAYFPGVNNTTVWHDPRSRSQIEFDSFVHLAQTAERGKLDFFFLAEGLRLREQGGKIHDLDTVGRPDSLTVLTALAAVTQHIGLAATLNATFHEPYELARQLATLDHLSGGRAAWNVVTSSDAFTGENFRKGGFLDYEDRYERAGEFVRTARELWDSWADDELVVDVEDGSVRPDRLARPVRPPRVPVRHPRELQRPPQPAASPGHPAGRRQRRRPRTGRRARPTRSSAGTTCSDPAQTFYERRQGPAARSTGAAAMNSRSFPGVSFVLGDTPDDAREQARIVLRQQFSPQTAILLLEQVWNRDLSAYDPDGPLPDIDPDVSNASIIQGRARMHADPLAIAARWRALAEEKHLSIRELVIETSGG